MKTPIIFIASCCDGKKPVQYVMVSDCDVLTYTEAEKFVSRFMYLYYPHGGCGMVKEITAELLTKFKVATDDKSWWLQVATFVENASEISPEGVELKEIT